MIVALVVLFGISDVELVGEMSPSNPRTTGMMIEAIGHQWWEVCYGNGRAVTRTRSTFRSTPEST